MIHETIQSMRQSWSVNKLTDFVVDSVQAAHAGEAPFYHLRFDRVFPDDFYVEMLQAMPVPEDYRAMSGKSKMGSTRPDGKPTRAKIDLFPEYIRRLPPNKGAVWDVAGRVLRSKELETAFVQRLAPGLKRRFGENFGKRNRAKMRYAKNVAVQLRTRQIRHSTDVAGRCR